MNAQEFERSGHWFKDSKQRYILFRGVNFASRTKLPPYLPTLPLSIKKLDNAGIVKFYQQIDELQSEFDKMKDLGINIVRLLVIWKGVEPEPSPNPEILSEIGEKYLELVKELVDNFYAREIFVIIDFHQDVAHELFDGDGFPDWALDFDMDLAGLELDFNLKLPEIFDAPTNKQWQREYFFNIGFKIVMKKFWENSEITYNGVSYVLQEHLSKSIGATARFFQALNDGNGHPGILGYEFFNEPVPIEHDFVSFEREQLFNFYKNTCQEVRRTVGDNHGDDRSFLFMEPRTDAFHALAAETSLDFFESKLDFSLLNDERTVFSFHYYDFSQFFETRVLNNQKQNKKKYLDTLENLKHESNKCGGIPFLTEFGSSNDWTEEVTPPLPPYDSINQAVMDLQYMAIEENLLNSTIWNYDFYVTPEGHDNWNLENFSLLGPNKDERNLEIFSRPYPMYSSSEPTYLSFDLNTKHCVMKFNGTPIDVETEIFIPQRRHFPSGFDVYSTSNSVQWNDDKQILVWNQNKNHHEHLMIICPKNDLNENFISPDELSKVKKSLSVNN